jgi:hypothetical protein
MFSFERRSRSLVLEVWDSKFEVRNSRDCFSGSR